MTLKSYIWGVRTIALFSFIAWACIINFVDPEATGVAGKTLFYIAALFALSSLFNLILLWIRKKAIGKEAAALNVGLSFRQGILLAVFVVGLLILQSLRILVWWDGLLLLAAIFLIELYFLNKQL